MKPTTACPSTDELHQLLRDSLPDSRQEQCAEHLQQCACCQAKLEELATSGTNLCKLVERLQSSLPAGQSAYWPAIRAASQAAGLGQAAGLAPTITPEPAPRPKDSSIQFLLPPSDPAYLGRLAHFDVMRVLGR